MLPASISALIMYAAAALALGLAAYGWPRRKLPCARAFTWQMLSVAAWSLAAGLEAVAYGVPSKVFWCKISYLGSVSVGPLWFLFAAAYADPRAQRIAVRGPLFWVVPVVVLLLAATNERHGLVWPHIVPVGPDPQAPLRYGHGPAAWANIAYAYLFALLGTWRLVRFARKANSIQRQGAAVILVGALIPLLASLLYVAGWGLLRAPDPTPIAFVFTGLTMAWGISRFRIFDLVPLAWNKLGQQMADGVLVTDTYGRVAFTNPALEGILGRKPPMGETAETALAAWPALAECVREPGEPHCEIAYRTHDDTRWFDAQTSPLTAAGEGMVGRLLVLRETTERKRAEDERREMDARLQQRHRLESLGVLAGGIAHMFNNSLMAILGNAELARMRLSGDSPALPHLDRIVHATDRAAVLARQMLALSGGSFADCRSMDLSQTVRDLGDLVRAAAGSVTIEYDLAANLPPVHADVAQFEEILASLVTNASEAIGEGPGTITITTRLLHADRAALASVKSHRDLPAGEYVSLCIRDTGGGMDGETLAKAFDPFFTTNFIGRGLGLPVVLGLATQHGGGARIESAPGKGTTVEVLLPVAEAVPAATTSGAGGG